MLTMMFSLGESLNTNDEIPKLGYTWNTTKYPIVLDPWRDQPLQLALDFTPEDEQRYMLEGHGWSVVDADTVAAIPWDYQRYIQDSFAEFSCAKPACLKLENAWLSNRTLCYLANGKPAVVTTQTQADSSQMPPACFGSAM
jgi:hypothetical protein